MDCTIKACLTMSSSTEFFPFVGERNMGQRRTLHRRKHGTSFGELLSTSHRYLFPTVLRSSTPTNHNLFAMASGASRNQDERAGAEVVHGSEECYRHSIELLGELGFPKGVLPLRDLVECGRVRETGFVWMKQKAPFEHFFTNTNTRVSYATEVTAYVEKFKMKKMTGVKSKQMFLWVPITEMSIEDPASKKIYFKTPVGIGKSFPLTAFMTEEEKQKSLENGNGE